MRPGQFITSINRRLLNEVMLSAAEKQPNVDVHFEHKLRSFDPASGKLIFARMDEKGQFDRVLLDSSDLRHL